MSGSYEDQIRAQQEMQRQQLQAQVDLQNKIISDHNAQIAQHQQQQLNHMQAQSKGYSSGQPAAYNPSANNPSVYNPAANQQDIQIEKPASQGAYGNQGNYGNQESYGNQGYDQNQNQHQAQPPQYETSAQMAENDEKNEEEVQEDSNNSWKIAAGIGGGLAAAAGLAYGGYKINQHMKEKSKREIEEAYQRNLASLEKANVPRMPSGNMAGYASSFNQSQSSINSYNQNYSHSAGATQSYGQQGGYNPNSGMPTPQHSFGPSSGAPQGYGQAGGQQSYGQPGGGPQGYGQSGGYGQPGRY